MRNAGPFFVYSATARHRADRRGYSHIIDDRRKNAELFEQAFYEKKNLDPSMHANVAGKTVELPTNVDAELLAKVLSNPEMAALLSTLAKSLESK